jgi:hypothetical protein
MRASERFGKPPKSSQTGRAKSAMPRSEWVRVRCPTVRTRVKEMTLRAQLTGREIRFNTLFSSRLRPLPRVLRGLSTSGSQAAATATG